MWIKKMMMNRVIVNFKKLNFHLFLIKNIGIYLIFFSLISLFGYYLLSDKFEAHEYPIDIHIYVVLGLVTLQVLGLLYPNFIYIYRLELDDKNILLEWQRYNQKKKIVLSPKEIKTEIIPSGFNNQYLRLTIISKEDSFIIKQYSVGKWSKKKMREVKDIFHNINQ